MLDPIRTLITLTLASFAFLGCAEKKEAPEPAPAPEPKQQLELRFGIVPQQAPSTIKKNWAPIARYLGQALNVKVYIKTAPSIPEFENRCAQGLYDISYMNPYHYTVFSKNPGYRAFARQRNKRIKGILVVPKDSPAKSLTEFAGKQAAFPSPAAFAASLLTRAKFKNMGVDITPVYVKSHDSVYANVLSGIHPVGGGVMRTFRSTPKETREGLRILWTTNEFTPHAFAMHPRISPKLAERLKKAFNSIDSHKDKEIILAPLKFKGMMLAEDKDWDDVRALGLNELVHFEAPAK
jgi:phosphonate transport system substrate-binding protein